MERHVWDQYADWGEVAKSGSSAVLKAKITGSGGEWAPNAMSDALLAVTRNLMTNRVPQEQVTVVDFGCGLGRNLQLLRSIFPRVIGIDIPEMIQRLRQAQAANADLRYDAVYDDIDVLLRTERIHFVYDSVVLQHIVDAGYVGALVDKLAEARSLVAVISVSIATSAPLALTFLADDYDWTSVFAEIDTVSFGGPHQVRVLCRPETWRLELRDGVIGIRPHGGEWRPVMMNGGPARRTGEWEAVDVLAELAPTLMLVFERSGERAVWFIDEDGHYLGNTIDAVPATLRHQIRTGLRRMLRLTLRRRLSGAGTKACADLLELAVPAADT